MNPVYAQSPEVHGNSLHEDFREFTTSGMVPRDYVHHTHWGP